MNYEMDQKLSKLQIKHDPTINSQKLTRFDPFSP